MVKLDFIAAPSSAPIDIARAYIAAGVSVFPCREAKQRGEDPSTGEYRLWEEKAPYTSNGLKDATLSPRIVNIWFGDKYPNAVIGLPTGKPLGAWVLDLDRHGDRDGHAWLAEMEAKHGQLPETARATTANGGTHIFFRHVEGVRNRAAIADGVDTRGDGGYIVGPGSVMADGRRYQWIDHTEPGIPPLADAPAWLLDLVITKNPAPAESARQPSTYTYQPEESTGAARYAAKAFTLELERLASSPKGQRGQQLFASACSVGELVATGHISRNEAEAGLLDSAIANGLVATDGKKQCQDKIKRGLDKTANMPRQIPEREFANDNGSDPGDLAAMVERNLAKKAAAPEEPDTPPAADVPAAPKKRERFEKTWFDAIEEGKPKETILKGWLGVDEFTTISGLPGTGKSVVATDLACHIAAGMDWHGIKVQQGLVVYVAAERKKLTERRMMAFRKYYGVKDVPLLVVGGMLDFTRDLADANAVIAVIREAETITNQKCVWVIIDTLTRAFGAGDQNASKDMVKFVRSCDHILSEIKTHVTAIHHSAWSGERGKGAIDLDGAIDASFMVKKDGKRHRLVCDGTNDGEEGDVLAFTMESVVVGRNEDGEETTAPIVRPAVDVVPKTTSEATRGKNARALELLLDLTRTIGITPESPGYPPGTLVVAQEDWRQAVYADAGAGIAAPALNKRYNRAKSDLLEGGLIGENVMWVWLIPDTGTSGT